MDFWWLYIYAFIGVGTAVVILLLVSWGASSGVDPDAEMLPPWLVKSGSLLLGAAWPLTWIICLYLAWKDDDVRHEEG